MSATCRQRTASMERSNAFGPSYSGHASFSAALTVMEVRHWRASMRIHRLFGFVLVFLITLAIPALHGQETPVGTVGGSGMYHQQPRSPSGSARSAPPTGGYRTRST